MDELLSGTQSTIRNGPLVFTVAEDPGSTLELPGAGFLSDNLQNESDNPSVTVQDPEQHSQQKEGKKGRVKRKKLPRFANAQEAKNSWVEFKGKFFNKHSFPEKK